MESQEEEFQQQSNAVDDAAIRLEYEELKRNMPQMIEQNLNRPAVLANLLTLNDQLDQLLNPASPASPNLPPPVLPIKKSKAQKGIPGDVISSAETATHSPAPSVSEVHPYPSAHAETNHSFYETNPVDSQGVSDPRSKRHSGTLSDPRARRRSSALYEGYVPSNMPPAYHTAVAMPNYTSTHQPEGLRDSRSSLERDFVVLPPSASPDLPATSTGVNTPHLTGDPKLYQEEGRVFHTPPSSASLSRHSETPHRLVHSNPLHQPDPRSLSQASLYPRNQSRPTPAPHVTETASAPPSTHLSSGFSSETTAVNAPLPSAPFVGTGTTLIPPPEYQLPTGWAAPPAWQARNGQASTPSLPEGWRAEDASRTTPPALPSGWSVPQPLALSQAQVSSSPNHAPQTGLHTSASPSSLYPTLPTEASTSSMASRKEGAMEGVSPWQQEPPSSYPTKENLKSSSHEATLTFSMDSPDRSRTDHERQNEMENQRVEVALESNSTIRNQEPAQLREKGTEENKMQPKDEIATQPLFECPICICDYEPDEVVSLEQCGHRYCRDCVSEYIRTKINAGEISAEEFTCPNPTCDVAIDYYQVRNWVDAEVAARYENLSLVSVLNDAPGVVWCPARACGNVMMVPDIPLDTLSSSSLAAGPAADGGSESPTSFQVRKKGSSSQGYVDQPKRPPIRITCTRQNCGVHLCATCGRLWHADQTCEEASQSAKGDEDVERWMKKHDARPCPNCSALIEKNSGCNHMVCGRCEYEFCWICMGKYEPGHYDKGGPCEGKQFPIVERVKVYGAIGALALVAIPAAALMIPAVLIGAPVYAASRVLSRNDSNENSDDSEKDESSSIPAAADPSTTNL